MFLNLHVFQHEVDEGRDRDGRSASQWWQLVCGAYCCPACVIEIDRVRLSPHLFAVLLSVLVVIDPPHAAAGRALKHSTGVLLPFLLRLFQLDFLSGACIADLSSVNPTKMAPKK